MELGFEPSVLNQSSRVSESTFSKLRSRPCRRKPHSMYRRIVEPFPTRTRCFASHTPVADRVASELPALSRIPCPPSRPRRCTGAHWSPSRATTSRFVPWVTRNALAARGLPGRVVRT